MGEAIQVTIEVGHKAFVRDKPDAKGNTHDWNVYVRGGDNQSIEKFIQKVVFNLHETFKKPQRVKNEPPYCVKESGYGMFEFIIEIHFNGTLETYKINYYLELQGITDRKPFCRLRKETITFQNPQPEFRKCLLDGGGIVINSNTTNVCTLNTTSPDKTSSIIYQPQIKHDSNGSAFSELFGGTLIEPRKPKKPQTSDKNKSSKQASAATDDSALNNKKQQVKTSSTSKISSQDTTTTTTAAATIGAVSISSSSLSNTADTSLNKSLSKKRSANEENSSDKNENIKRTKFEPTLNESSTTQTQQNPPKQLKIRNAPTKQDIKQEDESHKRPVKIDDNMSSNNKTHRQSLPSLKTQSSTTATTTNKTLNTSASTTNLMADKPKKLSLDEDSLLKPFQVSSNNSKRASTNQTNQRNTLNNRSTFKSHTSDTHTSSPSSTSSRTLSPAESEPPNSIVSYNMNKQALNENSTYSSNTNSPTILTNGIDMNRILDLFEKIEFIKVSKNLDLLGKICSIVKPFSYVDKKLFKFDLFSLNSNVLDEMESLLKRLINDTK